MQVAAGEPSAVDVRVVEELLRVLVKGQRALQMYLPNNPVYQRTLQQVTDAFAPVWEVTGRVVLDVHEDHVAWEGMPVFRQAEKGEGLPWQLYKDGLRQLVLRPGVETREIFDLLGTINHARMLPADSTDDLLTLMWEQEFSLIEYAFVEVSGDGAEFHMERSRDIPAAEATAADTRAEAAAGRPGVVDLADFDATLYFLDDAEVRYVQAGLDEEYRRDIREAAIDALLDILETQRAPAVREEVVGLLEEILPAQLATGGFRVAARILRELRIIASRAPDLDPALRDAVLSFEERLSTPDILLQLFRVLEESATHAPEEDVGEVLRELRPQALPVVLAQLARITSPSARRTLESSVEAIARTRPEALAALIDGGPGEALAPAIALAARLGLTSVVPAIVKHLGSPDVALRLIVVRALADLGTPTAITAIEGALSDAERSVRQAALNALMARGGSGGLLGHLERLLFGSDDAQRERSERRALFEAYGTVAGPAAIPRLRELFEPRGLFRRRAAADVLASALFALSKVATPEARLLAERCIADKDPVVRGAANAVLRDWPA